MEEIYGARKQIDETLGYEGKYPDFRKKGSIKGLKLVSSYDQSYFCAMEKNVRYFIKCTEEINVNEMSIQFLCGTAFLKKNETVNDIYSCCFNAKGRRLFKTVQMQGNEFSSADKFAKIAAKKAECEKLTKDEKEMCRTVGLSWKFFIAFALVAGGLFGIVMATAIFLLASIFSFIFGGVSGMLGIVVSAPWWQIFLFCFIGFGVLMSIIEAIAKTK